MLALQTHRPHTCSTATSQAPGRACDCGPLSASSLLQLRCRVTEASMNSVCMGLTGAFVAVRPCLSQAALPRVITAAPGLVQDLQRDFKVDLLADEVVISAQVTET